jgi:hypothetical protein
MRHCPGAENAPKRFDAVSVYLSEVGAEIEVQQNAFAWEHTIWR